MTIRERFLAAVRADPGRLRPTDILTTVFREHERDRARRAMEMLIDAGTLTVGSDLTLTVVH